MSLALNPLLIILFYGYGYIFIKIYDYFLFKKTKTQFETTIQGLIASSLLFLLFYFIPIPVFNKYKNDFFRLFILHIINSRENDFLLYISDHLSILFYLWLVFLYFTIIFACIVGSYRKNEFIQKQIITLTNRDYFQDIRMKFYNESLLRFVKVSMDNEIQYIGTLVGTADEENDYCIILQNPFIIEDGKIIQLSAEKLLIDTTKAKTIELLPREDK